MYIKYVNVRLYNYSESVVPPTYSTDTLELGCDEARFFEISENESCLRTFHFWNFENSRSSTKSAVGFPIRFDHFRNGFLENWKILKMLRLFSLLLLLKCPAIQEISPRDVRMFWSFSKYISRAMTYSYIFRVFHFGNAEHSQSKKADPRNLPWGFPYVSIDDRHRKGIVKMKILYVIFVFFSRVLTLLFNHMSQNTNTFDQSRVTKH